MNHNHWDSSTVTLLQAGDVDGDEKLC